VFGFDIIVVAHDRGIADSARGLFISEMAGYLTALMRSMVDGAGSRL